MDILFLLGRILIGGFFIDNGINHLRNLEGMAGYAGSKGVPAPKLAVGGSGFLLLFGGFSVLLGLQPSWGLIAILIFLAPVTLMMHDFWAIEDPQERQAQRVQFMKNLALAGAALMMLSLTQPWAYSLGM